jgi:quercetin dioxygenase-like cupin family protein
MSRPPRKQGIIMDIVEGSSCEVHARPQAAVAGSRVLRCQGDFRWPGVAASEYKQSAEHHRGVTRMGLVGEAGEATAFHLRYFEIAPGGFSSLEHHEHEHAVVVMRGRGVVQLGDAIHEIGFGDTVYVAPHEVHQFRNTSANEPFGFLCIVDAVRDRPVLV